MCHVCTDTTMHTELIPYISVTQGCIEFFYWANVLQRYFDSTFVYHSSLTLSYVYAIWMSSSFDSIARDPFSPHGFYLLATNNKKKIKDIPAKRENYIGCVT